MTTAERIARQAHRDQTEYSTGDPYIYHVERVVTLTGGGADAAAVAWLHDVIEDTPLTTTDLRAAGIPEPVIAAVALLTRPPRLQDGTYLAYIDTILASGDPLALAVKEADLVDHLRPNCPPRLRPRYERALERLRAARGVPLLDAEALSREVAATTASSPDEEVQRVQEAEAHAFGYPLSWADEG